MAVAVGSAVASALADGRPVVALESAIITHGLPRPRNLEVAEQLEDLLRTQAVVPATVGVIGGVATVGLSAAELKELACADGAAKVSVRDLPVVMARRASGGTTVAATAWLAHHVGIRVFATGGIGGVHRGAGHTFDESADLPTLAHTPITVVCAGVKSILDVPATLERLETLGVTVVGFQTRSFPGFYVTDSGAEIEVSVTGPDEVVAMMGAARALALPGALVVANPVPVAEQLDPEVHDTVIALALASAAAEGIRGPAITPYLLDRLYQATGGASLAANLAAVRNNVTVAGRIALAWSAHG
ncbi:MAG: pseudouridylate synthase [Acidimicrobiaceae bacterium]|nr:pseudouridylate synthase [Acidimicrobiaceae bacterium]MDQ1365454.1 pseudouridylate synthase [Acidimicrobiaceae bacterium]MDQ1440423.1 pseudouridylate synthase [Acidimicrobiaceae bacterium]